MNPTRPKKSPFASRWCLAALLALLWPAGAFAQADEPARWLLVFEVSPAMQKRLPATAEVLKNFFNSSAGGELHEGDSIGVWTCDQKLHTGQAPLTTWQAAQTAEVTSNLLGFLKSRKPAGTAQLTAMQPTLNTVVADSSRLTVVIFCTGESDLTAPPYSAGINQNFLDARAERKKNKLPFVVVLRSAAGKYVGCTVNYPPGAINQPPFPPAPPTNPPPLVVAPVAPAPIVVPDLVIVGTNVDRIAPAPPKPAPTAAQPVIIIESAKIVAPATNSMPVPVAPVKLPPTNSSSPAATPPSNTLAKVEIPAHTNTIAPVVPPIENHPAPATNKVEAATAVSTNQPTGTAATEQAGEPSHPLTWIAGGVLALAAVLVTVWFFRPGRRTSGSLITRSMHDEPPRK
jgi:hypothetical protein